jgi:formylglycine-generating enzyme required for sulfatase activity
MGQTAEFPWGDALPGPNSANRLGAGIGEPTRVASYPPNAAGLYDMAGNVWEFAEDLWDGDRRVIRGGSFGGSPVNLQVRFRDSHPAGSPCAHMSDSAARDRNLQTLYGSTTS